MTQRTAGGALGALLLLACSATQAPKALPKLPPANPQAVSKLVQGVQASKEPEGKARAMNLFEEAVRVDAELWEARYNLGVLRADAGDLASAERELGRAQQLAPNAEDVALALAEVRRRRRDSAGAIAALEPFVGAHPEARAAPIALIVALREGGKLDAAIALAHRVLVRRARDPYALSELALSHLERGETDTAELLSEEAMKSDPKSAVAERTAGLIALEKGDDAASFRHFSRASELDPNDTTARLNMGTVLLQAGAYERATAHFKAVRDGDPEDAAAAIGWAAARRAQIKKDDTAAFQEVEKVLLEVLRREPNHVGASFNLACLYAYHLKQPNDAEVLFRRFLAQAPSLQPAREEAETWLATHKK